MEKPKVGDWVTCKTEFDWDSEPGKILSINEKEGKFIGDFFTEEGDGESGEVKYRLSDIAEIITDPQHISELEEELR